MVVSINLLVLNLLARNHGVLRPLQQPTQDVAPLFRVLCPLAHAVVPLFRFHMSQGLYYTPSGLTMSCYRWDDHWFTVGYDVKTTRHTLVGSMGKTNDLLELGVLFLWGGHPGIRVDMVQFWLIGVECDSIRLSGKHRKMSQNGVSLQSNGRLLL